MKILKIILAVLLFIALAKMPYGYYQFLRIATCIGFGIIAYDSFKSGNKIFPIIYVALLILFQPIAKIILQKSTWQIIDAGVGIFLIIIAFEENWINKIGQNKS